MASGEESAAEAEVMASAVIATALANADDKPQMTAAEAPAVVVEEPPVPAPLAKEATLPSTPEKVSSEVSIEVEDGPTPGAVKFVDTITEASLKVGSLAPEEWSDGMYEISRRSSSSMKSSWSTFSTHALDLAIIVTTEQAPEQSKWKELKQQAEGKKLAMLPVAAFYAVVTAVCLIIFATIYYPKLYGPKLYQLAKAKLVEYKITEHASTAATALAAKSTEAYTAARSSTVTAKGLDYLSKAGEQASAAYQAASSAPAVVKLAEKSSEIAEKGRAKIAEKLVALRDGEPTRQAPVEPNTPV